jgi:hypothetical protein
MVVAVASMESTQQAPNLSQAHSLFSEDVGSVAPVDVSEVRFQPTESLLLSQSQHDAQAIAEMKIEKEQKATKTKSAPRMQKKRRSLSG